MWTRREWLARSAAGLAAASWTGTLGTSRRLWAGQASDVPDVRDFLEEQIRAGVIPGGGVVATHEGQPLLAEFIGTYASQASAENLVERDLRYVLYSTSKLIAATAIVMVQQDVLFDWDTPVSHYLPEFKGGGKDSITPRHLLTHSAGIPNVPVESVETEDKWKAAVDMLCKADVEWHPGTKCVYHGLTGHFVAAEICCRLIGKRWADLCRERLFQPLGAQSLDYDLPPAGTRVALVPQPKTLPSEYEFIGPGLAGHPAGACLGTLVDVIKVLQLHLNRGEWNGQTLIQPAAFNEMHRVQYADQIARSLAAKETPAYQTWGLGILLRGDVPRDGAHDWFGFGDRSSPAIFGHAGISTVMAVADPELKLAIALSVTDQPNPESKAGEIRNGVTNRISQLVADE